MPANVIYFGICTQSVDQAYVRLFTLGYKHIDSI